MTDKHGVGPVTAGIVGAVVGAAVGATAVALSQEKNRKFLKNKFEEVKKGGAKAYSDLKNNVENLSSHAEDKFEEARKY